MDRPIDMLSSLVEDLLPESQAPPDTLQQGYMPSDATDGPAWTVPQAAQIQSIIQDQLNLLSSRQHIGNHRQGLTPTDIHVLNQVDMFLRCTN
jgi:hypothetical protein